MFIDRKRGSSDAPQTKNQCYHIQDNYAFLLALVYSLMSPCLYPSIIFTLNASTDLKKNNFDAMAIVPKHFERYSILLFVPIYRVSNKVNPS